VIGAPGVVVLQVGGVESHTPVVATSDGALRSSSRHGIKRSDRHCGKRGNLVVVIDRGDNCLSGNLLSVPFERETSQMLV
jgi:hypothetical protein